jgi:hypothetical protein
VEAPYRSLSQFHYADALRSACQRTLEEKATRVFNSGEGFSIPSYSTARRVIESDKVSKHTS